MRNEYRVALNIQDACNLSGVVHEFSRVLETLWTEAREQKRGTDYVNTHILSKLYAAKIAELAGVTFGDGVSEAYRICSEKAKAVELEQQRRADLWPSAER